jgi:hypothetical protein
MKAAKATLGILTFTSALLALFSPGCTSVPPKGQYSPPTKGLVAWWRGEGNANDSAGGHNGVLRGGMTFTNGVFGQAFAAGSRRRVLVPDDPAFELTSFTIGAWVNIHSDSYAVLGRMSPVYEPYALGVDHAGGIGLQVNIHSGVVGEQLFAPISYQQWHQVTGTLNTAQGIMSVYIDGKLAARKKTSVSPMQKLDPAQPSAISIGNGTILEFPFLGEIDEVVLYSRALSPGEVASLAARPAK